VQVTPVKVLKPVTLMDPGNVTRVYGRAFVAGVLPVRVSLLQQGYLDQMFYSFLCFQSFATFMYMFHFLAHLSSELL